MAAKPEKGSGHFTEKPPTTTPKVPRSRVVKYTKDMPASSFIASG
ncbi:hypothetical protein [Chitinibacter sp. S2-10]